MLQEMRAKAFEMVRILQKSNNFEEKAQIDAKIGALITNVGLPSDVFNGINLNDTFRLEQQIGHALFLERKKESYIDYE